MRAFSNRIVEAFARVEAAAHRSGVTSMSRTPRIRDLEARVEELARGYDRGSPPVLQEDVFEAIGALEREMHAEVRRVARQPRRTAPPVDAFDALFDGVD